MMVHKIVRISVAITLMCVLTIILVLLSRNPSHDRNWQPFQEVMNSASVAVDSVTITNVRDWQHTSTTTYAKTYIDSITIAPTDIKQVWFTIQPFAAVDAVGHTMLTFELYTGEAYTLSIEARREIGEEYNSFKGLFREYELLYSWGTARDFLGVRLFFLKDDLYHYPLTLSEAEAWQVLQYVASATQAVYEQSQFYNTATANCTNLLAKAVNTYAITTQLPYGLAWNLPGVSDTYLQRHGYIAQVYNLEHIRSVPGLKDGVDDLQIASQMGDSKQFTETLERVAMERLGEK